MHSVQKIQSGPSQREAAGDPGPDDQVIRDPVLVVEDPAPDDHRERDRDHVREQGDAPHDQPRKSSFRSSAAATPRTSCATTVTIAYTSPSQKLSQNCRSPNRKYV